MASIYDIAQRAGVSISTVSRIMTGSANVRPEKAEAVREAMSYFDYEPNQFARGLVKQKSNMVGLYIESGFSQSTGDEGFAYYNMSLISGVGEVLSRKGYNLVILYGSSSGPDFLDQLRQKRIDGVIFSVVPTFPSARKSLRNMEKDGYPSVYVGKRYSKSGMNVYAQFEDYMFQTVSHLYSKGHRKIMIMDDPIHQENIDNIIARAAVELEGVTLLRTRSGSTSREEFMSEIVRNHALGATALCGVVIDLFPLLYGVLDELGLRIPEDISIVATEHREGLGRMFYPQVSAMYVPAVDIGRGAAEMLLKSIETPSSAEESRLYEARFIERESVRDMN